MMEIGGGQMVRCTSVVRFLRNFRHVRRNQITTPFVAVDWADVVFGLNEKIDQVIIADYGQHGLQIVTIGGEVDPNGFRLMNELRHVGLHIEVKCGVFEDLLTLHDESHLS